MNKKGFTRNRSNFEEICSGRGFTLIELLIVIAIIAVLAVIGVIIYSGIQGKARDVRRKADLQQMATAYEVNYNSGQYISLAGTQFSSGQIPKDPKDNVNYTCIKGPDSNCTTTDQTSFQICATLEDGSTFCRQAAQGGESIAFAQPSPSPLPSPSPAGGTCPYFVNGPTQVSQQTCKNNISGLPDSIYIKCSELNSSRIFDCTSTCSAGNYFEVNYYSTSAGTSSIGLFYFYPTACSAPLTATYIVIP